ncbi:MAG TPA: TolC family protein [Steroidobacteraceae bacterium]|nr:TolC family protein [Steroidobacteraceae bacterium]
MSGIRCLDYISNSKTALSILRALTAAVTVNLLVGCATVAPAPSKAQIAPLLIERGIVDPEWLDESSANSIDTPVSPLTPERAVHAAMMHSPKLQQVYGELGLARADILDAVQVSNPRITVASLAAEGAPGSQFVFGIAAPLVDLMTLPSKARLAQLGYEQARYELAGAILGVSLDVEADWYRYIGARQIAKMRAAIAEALGASADLAQRFYDAGNITVVQLNREKAAASEARIAAARAAVAAREAQLDLNLTMGVAGKAAEWTAEESLPLPVAQEDDVKMLHQIAAANSLELLSAAKGAEVAAGAARMAQRFRLLGTTWVGFDREREVDRSVIRGPTLDLELPIFNRGTARVARAEAQHSLAEARLQLARLATANNIDSAAERVRVMRDIVALYREALVPAREAVARNSQLEQNFALIGEFEVLRARADEYDAYQGLLEAVRDYWLARIELSRLVGSRMPSDAQVRKETPTLHELEGRSTIREEDERHPAHHHSVAPEAPASATADQSSHHHHQE